MNRNAACTVVAAALALAVSCPAHAEPAAQPTRDVHGARALARAGVLVAAAPGADAAQANPAALAALPFGGLVLAHRAIAPGVAGQSGALAIPVRGRFVLAADADIRRVDGSPAGSASTSGSDATYAVRAGAHVAMRLPASFALGLGVARYSSTLANGEARGVCADAGLHWMRGTYRAGAALRGAPLDDAAAADALGWSAGVARDHPRFEIAAQADGDGAGGVGGGASIAWRAARALELLAGARHDPAQGATFGAGLALAAGVARLEWGCRFGEADGVENAVGIAIAFGAGTPNPVAAGGAGAPRVDEATAPPLPVAPPVEKTAPPVAKTPPPAAKATPPAQSPARAATPRCWAVTAGTYPSLEAASTALFRLRAADLRADVEKRGAGVVVVVRRCVSSADAAALVERAARAGVRAAVEPE